jgi:tetratricopeptide (TPR) repeat protein
MNCKANKSASADKYFTISIYLALAVTTFIAYHQILHNEFVDFDDNMYVTENSHVQSGLNRDSFLWVFGFTKIVYWHPLTWLSHILDCQLFGLRPGMHHLASLLIHIASTLLLFTAFKRMTGAVWRSAFVAALFALHPINVDSVAWIAERKNVLSTFFWMLTMLTYVYYTEKPNISRYLLMIAAFVFGLLSKPMLVTLPFVLLLLDYWPLKRFEKKQVKKLILEKLPLFILTAVSTYVSSLSFKNPSGTQTSPMYLRLANALVSYIKYIFKMIWPADLAVFYPYPFSVPAWQVIGSLLLLICISAIVIWLMRKKPYLITGWLWYTGTLVPVLGLVKIGLWPAIADRWMYVPSVGIFIIIAWGFYDLFARWRLSRILISILAAAFLSALGICTYFQTFYWRNSITLFEHATAATKNNYIMLNNLGNTLVSQNKLDEAVRQFNSALQIYPTYAPTYNNLGAALELQGKLNDAIYCYRQVVRLDPDFPEAYNNLGKIFRAQGKEEQAISYYLKALELKPDFAEAHYNLANILTAQDKLYQASIHYRKAIQIAPRNADAYNNLANVFQLQGKLDEAINLYRQVLSINAGYAPGHHNLAGLLMKTGHFDDALEQYLEASRLKPDWPSPLNGIARIYITHPDANKRDAKQAIAYAQRAAELTKYEDPAILDTLAAAYAAAGQFEKAVKTVEKALGLTAGKDEESAQQFRKQLEIYRAGLKAGRRK